MSKQNNQIFIIILFSIILISFSVYSVDAFTWNRPTIVEATLNVNHSETSNSSDFWDNLDTPADIDHNLLNNLEWSVAGHTIDTDVDFDGNDLLDVDEAFFDGPVTIKQNGNTQLDIETETSTSYASIELINPEGYDVTLFMHGENYAGSRYGLPMSNMTLLDTDTPDNKGAFAIGNYYHNPLVFVTDAIPRLNITADGNVEVGLNILAGGNITVGGYFSGQPLDGSIGSGILNASSLKVHCGCVNASDEGGLDVWYPDSTEKIWNYGTNTYCDIAEDTYTVPDNAHTVYYTDDTCVAQTMTWANWFAQDINPPNHVRLFDVYTHNGDIELIKGASVIGITMVKAKNNQVNCGGKHLSVCDGMDITEGIFPEINMSAGHFKYINSVHTSVQRDSNPDGLHVTCYSDGSHTAETEIDIDKCDNGVSCDACPDNKFRRYYIYDIGWGATHTTIHQLAPLDGDTYTNLGDCMDTETNPLDYVIPDVEEGVAVMRAFYCGKRDDTAWREGAWAEITADGNGGGSVQIPTDDFVRYSGWGKNADANDYNLTNVDWGFFNNINISNTLYTQKISGGLSPTNQIVLEGNVDAGSTLTLDTYAIFNGYPIKTNDPINLTMDALQTSALEVNNLFQRVFNVDTFNNETNTTKLNVAGDVNIDGILKVGNGTTHTMGTNVDGERFLLTIQGSRATSYPPIGEDPSPGRFKFRSELPEATSNSMYMYHYSWIHPGGSGANQGSIAISNSDYTTTPPDIWFDGLGGIHGHTLYFDDKRYLGMDTPGNWALFKITTEEANKGVRMALETDEQAFTVFGIDHSNFAPNNIVQAVPGANVDYDVFTKATSGENKVFRIRGYPTGYSQQNLSFSIGDDGNALISATTSQIVFPNIVNITGNNTYVQNITALNYLTYSDFDTKLGKDALESIRNIRGVNGKVNHNTLSEFARAKIPEYGKVYIGTKWFNESNEAKCKEEGYKPDYEETCPYFNYVEREQYENRVIGYVDGWNIGNQQSELINAFQELDKEFIILKQENQLMKKSLCKLGEVMWC